MMQRTKKILIFILIIWASAVTVLFLIQNIVYDRVVGTYSAGFEIDERNIFIAIQDQRHTEQQDYSQSKGYTPGQENTQSQDYAKGQEYTKNQEYTIYNTSGPLDTGTCTTINLTHNMIVCRLDSKQENSSATAYYLVLYKNKGILLGYQNTEVELKKISDVPTYTYPVSAESF